MVRYFNNLLGKNRIRKKLLVYFMLTTFLMAMTSFYTYYNARIIKGKMNGMLMNNIDLNNLNNNVNKVEKSLESYLSTNHSDSIRDYLRQTNELRYWTEKVPKTIPNTESGLLLKDIKNMIETYLVETDSAVQSKREKNVNEYMMHYNEASKIFKFINMYISRLNNEQFQENADKYMTITNRINITQIVNIAIIIGAVLLNIILIFWFTFKITKPIISLAHSANEISRGNFNVQQVEVHTDDEISVMSEAFNKMTSSIKNYINQIEEKAMLESRLKEQEMQNLIIKSHLKEAELHALQSQINPHFIFNTLNAGAQLAMLEGADKTCTFVNSVANLFRYNLRELDKMVSLGDEVNNINNYVYILKTRFGNMIEFCQNIDKQVSHVLMPCMILQPLVENAFIHGISEIENGGRITLTTRKSNGFAIVEIEDNGKGMNNDKIKQILYGKEDSAAGNKHSKTGHTTGIGLNNVISRLKNFFNSEDVLEIYSIIGEGTRIVIKIPVIN